MNVGSHVEMALRTSARKAAMTAQGAKRNEWGIYTVISPTLYSTRPTCKEWQGRVPTTAQDKNASGIIATSSKETCTLSKTKRFNAKDFSKAVQNAKWPKKYDYDKGADWWLRKNAKDYGYIYKRTALVKWTAPKAIFYCNERVRIWVGEVRRFLIKEQQREYLK